MLNLRSRNRSDEQSVQAAEDALTRKRSEAIVSAAVALAAVVSVESPFIHVDSIQACAEKILILLMIPSCSKYRLASVPFSNDYEVISRTKPGVSHHSESQESGMTDYLTDSKLAQLARGSLLYQPLL